MIGYMAPPEASASDRGLFRSYQCGLCHTLGDEYGLAYRLFAGVDLVFFNIFLDLHREERAALGRRACVLSPVQREGRGLAVRERTTLTRFAAAFGVWVGVEKLRDDAEDEGGWLRALALRAFQPGQARARAVLEAEGFPIAQAEAWMQRQRALEAAPTHPLEQAAEPTQGIAELLFASAAVDEAGRARAARIGRHVGLFLFAMDNLLDLGRDLKAGQYNALARAFGLRAGQGPQAAAREAALGLAHRAVEELRAAVAELPLDDHGRYVRRALVRSFEQKLAAFEALSPAAAQGATLATLRPRAPLLPRVRALVSQRLALAGGGLRMAVAMLALYLFPSWKAGQELALQWGRPAFADTGDTGDTGDSRSVEDTGVPSGEEPAIERPCDLCCDFEDEGFGICTPEWLDRAVDAACQRICGDPCEQACQVVCEDPCSTACDNACGSACTSSGCGDSPSGFPGPGPGGAC